MQRLRLLEHPAHSRKTSFSFLLDSYRKLALLNSSVGWMLLPIPSGGWRLEFIVAMQSDIHRDIFQTHLGLVPLLPFMIG